MKLERIVEWIKDYVDRSGGGSVVIGLSGGLDSSVVAALCVRALGRSRVQGVIMPCGSADKDETDARAVANWLGISYTVQNLSHAFLIFCEKMVCDERTLGNVKARLRMTMLYAEANSTGSLVIGTGNRSELMTGYFTKYGDGGVDIEPIGHLYKTEVRELAKDLCVPQNIIDKPPSAGLWTDQTDEKDLGMTYKQLDECLMNGIKYPDWDIKRKVHNLITESEHKRQMPPMPERG